MKLQNIFKLIGLTATFAVISCSEQKTEHSDTTHENNGSSDLDKIILTEKPTNAISISKLRKTATAGDSVVFKGKVIGANIVFIKSRAMMILGDPDKLTSCDLKPGESCNNCESPWDVCCDSPQDKKDNILTIQVLDTSGNIIKTGLKGVAGIKELAHVIVTGSVDPASTKENMLINATGIYVQK